MGNCGSNEAKERGGAPGSHPTGYKHTGTNNTRKAGGLHPGASYEASSRDNTPGSKPLVFPKQRPLRLSGVGKASDNRDNRSNASSDSGWPWQWLEEPAPHAIDATRLEYSLYLKKFRILTNVEADAYQLWAAGDIDGARRTLGAAQAHGDHQAWVDADDNEGVCASRMEDSTVNVQYFNSPDYHFTEASQAGQRCQEVLNERLDMHLGDSTSADGPPDAMEQEPTPEAVKAYGRRKSTFPHVEPKTQEQLSFLVATLSACPLFQHLVRESELCTIASAMKRLSYKKGQRIHCKGYLPLDVSGLSVLYCGRVSVDGLPIGRGRYFGENLVTAVNMRARRNVTAVLDSEVFVLSNNDFTKLMARQAKAKKEKYQKWLKSVPCLNKLPHTQLMMLADALEEQKYSKGDAIITYGRRCNYMHLIVEGEVDVLGRGMGNHGLIDTEPRYICSFSEGHPVGYVEFFEAEDAGINIADVKAKTNVITARVNRLHFESIFGSMKELLAQLTDAPEYAYYRSVKASRAAPRVER